MIELSPSGAMQPSDTMAAEPVLSVRDLSVRFETGDGAVAAVNGISFDLMPGETLGIVGESGSGKSQLMMAIIGLVASNGHVSGSVRYRGQELVGLDDRSLSRLRGARIAMVFQDPMTSLNPYLSVERQMTEVLVRHRGMSRRDARGRALDMLDLVRIPDAKRRIDLYPHEFSGGMRQRVMIAMALLCQPDLLIADEPTTALDVTIQAQILDLMVDLKRELGMSITLITHDLGVIAGIADRVMVMYAGRVAELAGVDDLFYRPQHPYTRGLLDSMPRLSGDVDADLPSIKGAPPNLSRLPAGCAYRPRCPAAFERCAIEMPALRDRGGETRTQLAACHLDAPLTPAADISEKRDD